MADAPAWYPSFDAWLEDCYSPQPPARVVAELRAAFAAGRLSVIDDPRPPQRVRVVPAVVTGTQEGQEIAGGWRLHAVMPGATPGAWYLVLTLG